MVKKKEVKKKEKGRDDSKMYAFLATFLSIIGFVIALIVKRDDEYVMYYAKQSLVIFIFGAVAGIISNVLLIIPIIGHIVWSAIAIVVFLLWVFSWIYALSEQKKLVPIIGEYSKKIKL